jgi:hypothetical protein
VTCLTTGYNDLDPRDAPEPEPEKEARVMAAECPVCGDQEEENEHGFCPPLVLHLCSCGHYACSRCVKHCADNECANTICGDCASLCDGCADYHCAEHTIAKNYCEHCAPGAVIAEMNRPSYVYEGAER